MRISLLSPSHTWRLSEMDEVHLALLRQAAGDALLGQTEEGRKRLYPRPISEDEAVDEEEFLNDWHEFVSDELEEKFTSDVKTLLDDLKQASPMPSDGTPAALAGRQYELTLPVGHGGAWFSALNQARLMLDQHWHFHDENDQFMINLPPIELGKIDPQERMAAYLRYEIYCMIQEWLVHNVLE